jgi:hypothetical protein
VNVASAGSGTQRAIAWMAVLAGPVGWFAALSLMFWLTRPACESGDRVPMLVVGSFASALIVAGYIAARLIARQEAGTQAESLRFLANLAIWGNPVFLLVTALTLVPVQLLSPCGV